MMSCTEAITYFQEFMDKELDESHYLAIKKHIDLCDECQQRYEFEQGVRSLVKASCRHTPAPAYLRDRILKRLDSLNADTIEKSSRKTVRREKGVYRLFSVRSSAIAASLLMSVAGGIFYYSNYFHNDSINLVDNAVKNHVVAVNDNLVFNEKTSVVGNVNKYLGNNIHADLNNSSPFLKTERISVMGGVPARSSGTSSPCIIFNKGDNKLSLQVVRNSRISTRNLERVKFGTKEFYIGHRLGFNSVLWEEEGATYCLTSDMNKNEMLRFAATLTSR